MASGERESDRATLSLIKHLTGGQRTNCPARLGGRPGHVKIEKTISIESIRER